MVRIPVPGTVGAVLSGAEQGGREEGGKGGF